MRLVFVCLCLVSFLFSQEAKEENRVVKTSELELFLFKVGFQSLLSDVDITKDKSIQNEQNINELKNKVKIIMDEVYKDKRLLVEKDNDSLIKNAVNTKEIDNLKREIELLKTEIRSLKNNSSKLEEKVVSSKLNENYKIGLINKKDTEVREKAISSSKVKFNLKKDTKVMVISCDKFDWCEIKLNNKRGFVAKYLLKL